MPEFGNKGNRISSQNEEFIILFLLEVRKAFSEFCKHMFFQALAVSSMLVSSF